MAETQTADVATSETRANTAYGDLTTPGPTVTADIGASGAALVIMHCELKPSTAGGIAKASLSLDAATPADADACAYAWASTSAAGIASGDAHKLVTGMSQASHVFKMQYAASAGTGTFLNRRITVIPLDSGLSYQTNDVLTSQTTTTTAAYLDLTTAGPSVTVTAGASGLVLVLYTAQQYGSAATCQVFASPNLDAAGSPYAYDVDACSYKRPSTTGIGFLRMDAHKLYTGLSAASHTFKLMYKLSAAGTGTFLNRRITAIAL